MRQNHLASARALIQADLDHARSVLALWNDQVSELEKALEQISLVDNSRTALRGAYQGQKGSLPEFAASNGSDGKAGSGTKSQQAAAVQSDSKGKKQRAAKSASTSAKSKTAEDSPRMAKRSPIAIRTQMKKKRAVPGAAKYRDPNSNRTWTGHGRRPGWVVGTLEQYAIANQAGSKSTIAGKNNGADTEATANGSA